VADELDRVKWHEFERARADFGHGRSQATRILLIDDDSVAANEHGASQNGAKVLRVGHLIKEKKELSFHLASFLFPTFGVHILNDILHRSDIDVGESATLEHHVLVRTVCCEFTKLRFG